MSIKMEVTFVYLYPCGVVLLADAPHTWIFYNCGLYSVLMLATI